MKKIVSLDQKKQSMRELWQPLIIVWYW